MEEVVGAEHERIGRLVVVECQKCRLALYSSFP